MNLQRILLTALALTLPLAGARGATFTTNATIVAGDFTYDGQPIVVSNCTLTVNGPHSFASLLLISGAVLTHSPAPNGEATNRLDLSIAGGVTVDASSSINADGLGYGANLGPGAGSQSSWGGAGGGGHGGYGGDAVPGAGHGLTYGSMTAPVVLGSGGNYHSGAGGGIIRLAVGGTLTVAGVVSANGNNAFWQDGGGGSGGSVFLSAATLTGAGAIRADGGSSLETSSGGGGGGRVALLAETLSFTGSLSAIGGTGFQAGGAGTIFTRVTAEAAGRLSLNNAGRAGYTPLSTTNAPTGLLFSLDMAGSARVVPLTPMTFTHLALTNGAMLTHERLGQPLRVNVLGSANIATGASINADGAGYRGSNRGPGAGGWSAWGAGGGGGYGGRGGAGLPGGGEGSYYGSAVEPLDFGSAGLGGVSYGGGSVRLAVGGTLTVNGSISANGVLNNGAGGAAGGSIYLLAGAVAGAGLIQADGSGVGSSDAGGGGGGRIAIHAAASQFSGAKSVAGGPGGFSAGSAGTIYLTNGAALCGTVRDASQQALAGVTISATGGYMTVSDAAGGFVLSVPSGWSGSVSATATDQPLVPASRTFSNVLTPQFGVDFGGMTGPVITSASSATGQVAQGFTYVITASGSPTLFGATGLPAGLTLNPNTGVISGTPTVAGSLPAQIMAANALGTNTAPLNLTILPWPGLISWWRGEGDASDTLGTHPGAPLGGLAYGAGQVGQAFALNGQDAAVAFGNWFTFQQFTISCWVKPGATQVQHADIFDNNHSGTKSWVVQSANVSDATRSQWLWHVGESSGGWQIYFWLPRGAWQHWVVTLGADRVQRLYLNGALAGSFTNTGPVTYDGSQFFNLGKNQIAGRYFNGLVDEVMVFDRALTAAEVGSVFVSQGGRPTLDIQAQPGSVLLSWPAAAAGYRLVSRTDLTIGTWEMVTNEPVVNGSWNQVLLPTATPAQRFFRLQSGR